MSAKAVTALLMYSGGMRSARLHYLVISFLALLALLPLLAHGCSCGHDMSFHVQSWLEAAQQFRHGTFYPQWAYSPAWQAGEPRFIFYPPLSWILGAVLISVVSANWAPVAFTWLVLVCAGFSMNRLAREWVSPSAALLAAGLYLANPYMLFNALERGAYAELLVSVWIPLIFLAVLRARPTVHGLAIPLALTWLTNAPAGVMATYTVALVGLVRLLMAWKEQAPFDRHHRPLTTLALRYAGGLVLGLALVSFYLVPAAYERRYVQVDLVIMPNLRYQDNFLFSRTDYEPHNIVTHTISVLALAMLLLSVAVICLLLLQQLRRKHHGDSRPSHLQVAIFLALLVVLIGFLLVPLSAPVWEHLPNLKFLQFPWRLLTILSVALALAIALLVDQVRGWKRAYWFALPVAVLALSQLSAHFYRQGCDPGDYPSFLKSAFETNHGVVGTDEYTSVDADNDVERPDDPGYWLTSNLNGSAPGTTPNPNETIPNYDAPMPFDKTHATRAPHHLSLDMSQAGTLVFNLRDYPSWIVTRNGQQVTDHLHRDDGLLALSLPRGTSVLDIHWKSPPDRKLGFLLSACALVGLCLSFRRSRRINS